MKILDMVLRNGGNPCEWHVPHTCFDRAEYERIYIAYWGSGYQDGPVVRILPETWFTKEKQYKEKDQKRIKNLGPGESYDMSAGIGLDQTHVVTRII